MIAALYVQTNGVYFNLPDVDPWDEKRDARLYPGPHAVVAHPPCVRWCQLAYVVQARYGHRIGDDGGCFASALNHVRAFGGVLEHPALSLAWPRFDLLKPTPGQWTLSNRVGLVEWVTEVYQRNYGHRALKKTWLLYVGAGKPFALDWDAPDKPEAQVSWMQNHGNSALPRLSKAEASRTPVRFRDALLRLAEGSQRLS